MNNEEIASDFDEIKGGMESSGSRLPPGTSPELIKAVADLDLVAKANTREEAIKHLSTIASEITARLMWVFEQWNKGLLLDEIAAKTALVIGIQVHAIGKAASARIEENNKSKEREEKDEL